MLITECVTSQPEACYPWLQKLMDVGSWTTSENLFIQWQDFFLVPLSTNLLVRGHSCVSSHVVSSENPRCVSDRPRQHRRMCRHFKRLDFVFENCQMCSSESTQCGDGILRGSIALMALVSVTLSFRTTFSCHSCPVATEDLLLCLRVDKRLHTPGHAPILAVPAIAWGHVHLLGIWHHRRVCWLRKRSHEETRDLQRASDLPRGRNKNEVVAQLRRLFDCSRCGESRPRDVTHTLHHGRLGTCVHHVIHVTQEDRIVR